MDYCSFLTKRQTDRQDSQFLNNEPFYRPSITSAQCINSTDKNTDSAILLNYDDDKYSQGYGEIKETIRALTKHDNRQPYFSDHDFRPSKEDNDFGYNLYDFDIR